MPRAPQAVRSRLLAEERSPGRQLELTVKADLYSGLVATRRLRAWPCGGAVLALRRPRATAHGRMHNDLGEMNVVLESIYDAGDGATPWASVLRRLLPRFAAEACHHYQVDGAGALLEPPCGLGVPPERLREYHQTLQAADERFSIAVARPGVAHSDVTAIDPSAFERTAVYTEHLRPQGLRYSLFALVPVGEGAFSWQGFLRSTARGPFSSAEVLELDRLLPHLARTLRIRRMTRRLHEHQADLQAMLDRLAPAALVVEPDAHIVCTSARAEALLRAGDGIRASGERLSSSVSTTRLAIMEAVRTVDCDAGPRVVEARRDAKLPLRLIFLPLRAPQLLGEVEGRRPRLLVLLQDPELMPALEPELVSRVHRLTPAEAHLAVALTEGSSLAEFAREQGKSEHTVRTQLKRILEKTDSRRQSDLVRLLLTSAVSEAT